MELLRDINRSGTTVILATHDTVLVDLLHTRVIRLENGKVIRDSIGGYEEEPKQERSEIPQAIFVSPIAQKKSVGEALHPQTKGRKKIHITAIGVA